MNKIEKLTHLRNIVAAIPPSEFDMYVWWRDQGCRTVGCAAGHACQDPAFQKLGLFYRTYGGIGHKDPLIYDEFSNYQTLGNFFEIGLLEAQSLFHPMLYTDHTGETIPLSRVLSRIDKLIEYVKDKRDKLEEL